MKKAILGQNFLNNKNIAEKITNLLEINNEDDILEVGPGKGILTQYLIKKINPQKLTLVEKDKYLIDNLKEQFSKIKIINQDILKLNLNKDNSLKIISNLPYYISRDFFLWMCINSHCIKEAIIMVQKEFAQKILEEKKRGDLNLIVNSFFDIKKMLEVAPGNFSPPPKIQSWVLKLKKINPQIIESKSIIDYKNFVIKLLLQRRRNISNNLAQVVQDKSKAKKILEDLNIKENTRAETLSPQTISLLFKKIISG